MSRSIMKIWQAYNCPIEQVYNWNRDNIENKNQLFLMNNNNEAKSTARLVQIQALPCLV